MIRTCNLVAIVAVTAFAFALTGCHGGGDVQPFSQNGCSSCSGGSGYAVQGNSGYASPQQQYSNGPAYSTGPSYAAGPSYSTGPVSGPGFSQGGGAISAPSFGGSGTINAPSFGGGGFGGGSGSR